MNVIKLRNKKEDIYLNTKKRERKINNEWLKINKRSQYVIFL